MTDFKTTEGGGPAGDTRQEWAFTLTIAPDYLTGSPPPGRKATEALNQNEGELRLRIRKN